MNGAQDLGGAMGFGPVVPEPHEPWFHEPWEAKVLALTLAMGGLGEWTIDHGRHARESLPPAIYLSASYYEIWLRALERQVAQAGLASETELRDGVAVGPAAPTRRPPWHAQDIGPVLAKGFPYDRPAQAPARFAIGARVRTKVMNPIGHTRLPRYARGKTGTVERVHGVHVYPDASARGLQEAHWLYSVAFSGPELWGEGADPKLTVSIEAFEPYLESA